MRAAAAAVHIEALLGKLPRHCSGGESQRVALARTIVTDPAVFLMDEPLSSLDAKLRVDMRTELKGLHKRLNATFVYVTHDQAEAMTMADRIVVMSHGRIEQVGTPLTIYNRPATRFVAGFFGMPTMNFLEGTVESTAAARLFRSAALDHPLPDAVPADLAGRKRRARRALRACAGRRRRVPQWDRAADRAARRRDARAFRVRRTRTWSPRSAPRRRSSPAAPLTFRFAPDVVPPVRRRRTARDYIEHAWQIA